MILAACTLVPIVGAVVHAVAGGARPEFTLITVLPGLEIGFKAEPLGALFALVAAVLWVATSFYAIGYMRAHHEENQTRFFICFAIAMFATMGAAFARDLFTLFVFYEALTLSTYPLVTHHGTEKARKAGRVYLGILLGTSILLLLPAIVLTYVFAGTLEFTPGGILGDTAPPAVLGLLLAMFAFGAGKAALMPFHRWLPAAMVAPTPVSALLHAVAVVKVGVFTVLKISVYIFGTDLLTDTGISVWLEYVAAATILLSSAIAITCDNLKKRLAYSTISQLAYITLAAAIATSDSVIGGGMHIVMHAFGKITLFFCAGAIYVTAHKTKVSELDGLGHIMPFTFIAFGVATISIIGLPPLGGSWSKWFIALGAVRSGHFDLVAVLMLSSLLNIVYLMPIPIRAFFLRPPAENPSLERKEAPLFCVIPLCMTAAATVALFIGIEPIYQFLKPLVGD